MNKTTHRLIALWAVLMLLATAVPLSLADGAAWDGQAVSEPAQAEGVYQIGSAAELAWLAGQVNRAGGTALHAVLTNDIDLNNQPWMPMGGYDNEYTGSFDGQGHKVTGLFINAAAPRQGLFGMIGESGLVTNLTVDGAVSSSMTFVGGIAGWNKGTVSKCVNLSAVTGTAPKSGNASKVGGIAGQNSGAILNCRNSGRVTALKQVGGIAGYQTDGRVAGCYNDGFVTAGRAADNTNVGGLIGQMDKGGLYYSVNAGAVVSQNQQTYGNFYVGGLVGQMSGSRAKTAFGNYNTGEVSYTNPVTDDNPNGCNNFGFLYGSGPSSLTAYGSYYLAEGTDWAPQAMTADEMKAASFVSLLNGQAGTDECPVTEDMRYAAMKNGYPLPSWLAKSSQPQAVPVAAVSITGMARAGAALTAVAVDEAGEASTQPAYQWQVSGNGQDFDDIGGAAGAVFTIPEDMSYVGKILRVTASGVDESAAISAPTPAVDRSDAQKVSEAKEALALDIPAAIRENAPLALPASGLYGTAVAWSSDHKDVISDAGVVTLPGSGIVSVTLTATLTCGDASPLTKAFTFAVYSAEAVSDQDYVDKAVETLRNGYFKLIPTYGVDTNVNDVLRQALERAGFDEAAVAVKACDGTYIDSNGDITYFYDDPNSMRGVWFAQSPVTFAISKGSAAVDYALNAVIHWDGAKACGVLQQEIVDQVTETVVAAENPSLTEVTRDLTLPKVMNGKKWSLITWQSSNPAVLAVDGSHQNTPDTLFAPYIGRVKRGMKDQTVTLKATFSFQLASSDEPVIEGEKTFTVVIKALEGKELQEQMQAELSAGYTAGRLTDMDSGAVIAPQAVTNDIQLPIPRNTGVPQYDQYTFSVASDTDSAVVTGYRVNVYRPLPGEADKAVTLTVTMRHKQYDVAVTTSLPLTVKALTQAEIDRELALMDAAKAAYFDGINRAANADAQHVTASLSAFKEVVMNGGSLAWHYTREELTGGGIVPVSIDETHPSEAWDRFYSSNPTVLSHENLLLTQPEYTRQVTITSCLSSETFEKYAVRYPDNAVLQQLYRQPVSAALTVIGSKGEQPAPPDKINGTFTLIGDTLHGTGAHVFYPTWMDGESYTVEEGATVMDVFTVMMKAGGYTFTGSSYVSSVTTPEGLTLKAGDNGLNSGWMYAVNGKLGGVYADAYVLKQGDRILWFYTDDYASDSRGDGEGSITPDPSVPLPDYAAQWGGFHSGGGVTQALTAREASQAGLKWAASLKQADDWATAISEPLVVNSQIYVAVGRQLVVLDKEGRVTAKGSLASAIGFTCRPLYSGGRVMVPLADGRLQALAADSLKTVWLAAAPAPYVSEDGALEHQASTTLTADGGRLYMGTACADYTTSYYGVYRCIDMATGKVIWEHVNDKAGYYWSGAVRVDDAVLVAGDDGRLTSLDAQTGAVLDTLPLGSGVRSTLVARDGAVLAVTTDGRLHAAAVENGRFGEHKSVAFAASSTSTPTVYDGKAYVGGGLSEAEEYTGVMAVIDLETMTVLQTVKAPGDVKAAPLVATGYDGAVYAYFTANVEPGAVYVLRLGDAAKDAAVLYTPAAADQNYCMASVITDGDGILYYINDSGKLFAIENTAKGTDPTDPTHPKPSDPTNPDVINPTPTNPTDPTVPSDTGTASPQPDSPATGESALPLAVGAGLPLLAAALLLCSRRRKRQSSR